MAPHRAAGFPRCSRGPRGAELYAGDGRMFVDFFCGAGTLNFGHNHEPIKRRVAAYLLDGGLIHGLDVDTSGKRDFLTRLRDVVLLPRGLDYYKVQFVGPTGTDAVEAALKLVRKATGRGWAGGRHLRPLRTARVACSTRSVPGADARRSGVLVDIAAAVIVEPVHGGPATEAAIGVAAARG